MYKKSIYNKIITYFLSMLAFFVVIANPPKIVLANSNTVEKASDDECYGSYLDDDVDIPYYKQIRSMFSTYAIENGLLPKSYDSRDYGYITSVKNQEPFGSCWAFATIGALETTIIKNGLDSAPDLSELHLAYFTYHNVDDSFGNLGNDRAVAARSNYLDIGGNGWVSMLTLSNWKGAVYDDDKLSYENIVAETKDDALKLLDSYSIDSKKAYDCDYQLRNAYVILMQNQSEVKKEIIKNGAVLSSYYHNNSYLSSANESYYLPESASSTNGHAILIVGWDDNYSKDNFKTAPENDGAWLIKNSWGDRSKYIWISYYDKGIKAAKAFSYYTDDKKYDYNYQYDGTSNYRFSMPLNNSSKLAQSFKVEGNESEKLEAVSIVINDDNISYTIDIYINGDGVNPESGQLISSATTTGRTTYSGMYTIPLKECVNLKKGERFTVVFTLKDLDVDSVADDDTKKVSVLGDASVSGNVDYIHESLPGRSFVCKYNSDTSSYEEWKDLYSYYSSYEGATPRIKAYTNKSDFALLNKKSFELVKGQSDVIRGIIFPMNNDSRKLVYESDNSAVATVSSDGKINAKASGIAYINCYKEDGSLIAKAKVYVTDIIQDIIMSTNYVNLSLGDEVSVKAYTVPYSVDSSKICWKSSDNSVVTVADGVLTGVGAGEAYVSCYVINQPGVLKQCRVVVE